MASEIHHYQKGRHHGDHHAKPTYKHNLATIHSKHKQVWYVDDTAARVKIADLQVIAGTDIQYMEEQGYGYLASVSKTSWLITKESKPNK